MYIEKLPQPRSILDRGDSGALTYVEINLAIICNGRRTSAPFCSQAHPWLFSRKSQQNHEANDNIHLAEESIGGHIFWAMDEEVRWEEVHSG